MQAKKAILLMKLLLWPAALPCAAGAGSQVHQPFKTCPLSFLR